MKHKKRNALNSQAGRQPFAKSAIQVNCQFNAVIKDENVTITALLRSESNIYLKSIFDKYSLM